MCAHWETVCRWLVLGICLIGCSDTSDQTDSNYQSIPQKWAGNWPHAVTYEIFVQSFYDTNGDGIGDLNGVTAKLDYLKDLGVEAIWLMPINPAPSYHKYDVTDYRDIHPDYGTLEDFKRLVQQAHDRNIKIVMDLVINHTSSEHPWFQGALQGPENEYRDYYVWADRDSIAQEIQKKTITLDSDNLTQWHGVEGDAQHYYGFFWGGMPDLNFDNPQLRQEIFDIGRFWLQDMEVDGFRLDAARHIFPDDRPADNHEWWRVFREEMQQVKPDVYLLGEVYADAQTVAPYLEGLPALFNFDIGRGIIQAVKNEQGGPLLQQHLEIRNFYQGINENYIDAIFTTNHDQNRLASELAANRPKMRMAAALLLTLPGSPFLYYGEELGMLGVKPDEHIREPFNWAMDGSDDGETTWLSPKYSHDRALDPLSQQQNDSLSMFHHYKTLIGLRNNNPALTYGSMDPVPGSPAALSSFLRIHEMDTLWVIHNLAGREQRVAIGEGLGSLQEIIFSNGSFYKDQESITLAPYSTMIISN